MHRHRNKVGEGLVIEDREQAEQDHLDDVGRKRDPPRFELRYWNASPFGYGEVFR